MDTTHGDSSGKAAEVEVAGLVSAISRHTAPETIAKLEAVFKEKKIQLFAKVDHAANAAQVGMNLRPTVVVLFGNPQTGTPLMQSAQTIGIDLPLKILVWDDSDGKTWLSFNDPRYLAKRHGIDDRNELIAAMNAVLAGIVRAAAT